MSNAKAPVITFTRAYDGKVFLLADSKQQDMFYIQWDKSVRCWIVYAIGAPAPYPYPSLHNAKWVTKEWYERHIAPPVQDLREAKILFELTRDQFNLLIKSINLVLNNGLWPDKSNEIRRIVSTMCKSLD